MRAWDPESAHIDFRPWDDSNILSRNSMLKTTSSTSNTDASHLVVHLSSLFKDLSLPLSLVIMFLFT